MPTTKVTVGALAGAIVTVIVWIVGLVSAVEIPAEASAGLVAIVSFALSYLVPETAAQDGPAS